VHLIYFEKLSSFLSETNMCPGACVIIKSTFDDKAPNIAVTPSLWSDLYIYEVFMKRTAGPKNRLVTLFGLDSIAKIRSSNIANTNR